MTATVPPPPGPPPPPPPTRAAQAPPRAGALVTRPAAPLELRGPAALGRVRSAVRGTPGTMRLVSAGLVLLGLLVGLAASQSFRAAQDALGRAAENATQIVRLQGIQTSVVRADALATNAFLVGGLEPPEQRAEYQDAVERASALVPAAAAAQPADGEVLAALDVALLDYTDGVAVARANNRQALPVGAQFLREASAGLRTDALPLLEALQDANEVRAEAEFDAAGRAGVLVVVVCALGLVAVVVALVWLARRTHRYVNVPVAGAWLVILVVLVVSAVVLGSVAGRVDRVRDGPYATALALSDARIAAFDAKANESLTLIARGSGAAYEEAWTQSAEVAATRLADAAGTAGTGDVAGLAELWAAYAETHAQVRALDDGGSWDDAVALATSRDGEGTNAAFAELDAASAARLDEASAETTSALRAASSGLAFWAWLGILAGLATAGLAWWGMAQRIEEYR